jgi:exopolyphosphatase/pppGpp-phosphohydrolase
MPKYIVLKDIKLAGKVVFKEGDTFEADYPVIINGQEQVLVIKDNEMGGKSSFFLSFGNDKEKNDVYYDERKQEVGVNINTNQQGNHSATTIPKNENKGFLQQVENNLNNALSFLRKEENKKYVYLSFFVVAGIMLGVLVKKIVKKVY